MDLGQALDDRGRKLSAERKLEIEARQSELDRERNRTGNGHSAQTKAFDEEQSSLDRAREKEREVVESLNRAKAERESERSAMEDVDDGSRQEPEES